MLTMRYCMMMLIMALMMSVSAINAQDAPTAAGTYNEGLAMLKSKEYEGGLAKMEMALELAMSSENEQIIGLSKKNGAVAAYNLGNSKRKAGDHDGAIALYNKGIELNPSYSSNYEGIGRAEEAKGDKVAAVNSYIMAAKKANEEGKADKVTSRYKKAEVLIGKTYVSKDYDTAISMAEAYNADAPANADVNYYLSRSFGAMEKYTEGIAAMRKAVEIKGGAVPDKYTFYLAEQLEKSGNGAEAKTLYSKVTEEKYKAQATYRASQL